MCCSVKSTVPIIEVRKVTYNYLNLAHFMLEATPPLRIVSLCSVNDISFANGNSGFSFGRRGSASRGVRKKTRPVGVCDVSIINRL